MDENRYELKIESEIGGGSLSIFKDEKIFYKSEGFLIEKKSDHIIEVIKNALIAGRIRIGELNVIKYSESPGSQMGLKILASIVKGFTLPYKIDVIEKNVFNSLFEFYRSRIESEFCIILPVNKRESVLELSSKSAPESNKKFRTSDLLEIIREVNESKIKTVLPLKIFDGTLNNPDLFLQRDYGNVIDTGDNLSIYL